MERVEQVVEHDREALLDAELLAALRLVAGDLMEQPVPAPRELHRHDRRAVGGADVGLGARSFRSLPVICG